MKHPRLRWFATPQAETPELFLRLRGLRLLVLGAAQRGIEHGAGQQGPQGNDDQPAEFHDSDLSAPYAFTGPVPILVMKSELSA